MGHICPNCFEPAPVLFGICPECDKPYPKECLDSNCNHCYSTRDEMIKNSTPLSQNKQTLTKKEGKDV